MNRTRREILTGIEQLEIDFAKRDPHHLDQDEVDQIRQHLAENDDPNEH